MTRTSKLPTLLAGLATTVLLVGCGTAVDDDFGAQPAPPSLSDPNVASVISTVNEGTIDVASLAVRTAEDPDVRRFAERLVQEHGDAGDRLRSLLQRERIEPSSVQLTRDVADWNRTTIERLRDYESGAAFDRTFIEHEIAKHRWVIDALEGTLIPSTRDGVFRAALVELADHMREHLSTAQRIERTL